MLDGVVGESGAGGRAQSSSKLGPEIAREVLTGSWRARGDCRWMTTGEPVPVVDGLEGGAVSFRGR